MSRPDVIGTIQKRTGGTDENPIYKEVPGYHVNTTEPVPEWEKWRVEPSEPYRVFFNHPTYFYSFPGRAKWKEVFPDENKEADNPRG